MRLVMSLQSETMPPGRLQDFTREFGATINRATEVKAEVPPGVEEPGAKGDAVTLGTLALTFMTSGAAVALFEVAKAYFSRDKSLVLKLARDDGQVFELKSENLKSDQIDRSLHLARAFLEGGP